LLILLVGKRPSATSALGDVVLSSADAVEGGARCQRPRSTVNMLAQAALATVAGRAEQEHVLPLRDEGRDGEFVDQRLRDLPVDAKVKAIERALGITKAGLLEPAREEPILAAQQFVAHERREQIDRGLAFLLRLAQSRLEYIGHAGEAQLAQRGIEFGQRDVGSPVVRSIRSRETVS
jgi:hypothetical protein